MNAIYWLLVVWPISSNVSNSLLTTIQLLNVNDPPILLLSKSVLLILLQDMIPMQETTVLGSVRILLPENLPICHPIYWLNWPPMPTTIANVVPPPQLNLQHVINPPCPAATIQDTALPTDVATHRPSLPPVTPRIL